MYKLSPEDLDKIVRNTIEDKLKMEELLKQGVVHGVHDLSYYNKEIARDTRILVALSNETIKNIGETDKIKKEDKEC